MSLQSFFRLKDGRLLEIREAQAEDALRVFNLRRTLVQQTDNFIRQADEISNSMDTNAKKLKFYQESKNSLFLLALEGNQGVALAGLEGKPLKRIQHCATLYVGVLKQYWKQGIGEQLVQNLLQWAKENEQLKKIEIHVRTLNQPAIHLYQKFGFTKVGTLSRSLKIKNSFEDELIMEMWLPEI